MSYLIDSHAHLDFKHFDSDRNQVIQKAFDQNVRKIINVGTSLENSLNSIRLAEKYPFIWASVGIHPHETEKEIDLERLKQIAQNEKVVAIGEIGLDFHRINKGSPIRKKQEALFAAQLKIAQELNLPVIIHSRDAFKKVLSILEQFKVKAVFHCWSYDYQKAKKALDLGHLISFTATVTYPKAKNVQEVTQKIPIDSFWLETDCPYLSPQKHRGERNKPVFIWETAQKIAELRNISVEEIVSRTTENAERFFKI